MQTAECITHMAPCNIVYGQYCISHAVAVYQIQLIKTPNYSKMCSCLQSELYCCGDLINVLWRPVMRESLIIQIHQLAKVLDDPT